MCDLVLANASRPEGWKANLAVKPSREDLDKSDGTTHGRKAFFSWRSSKKLPNSVESSSAVVSTNSGGKDCESSGLTVLPPPPPPPSAKKRAFVALQQRCSYFECNDVTCPYNSMDLQCLCPPSASSTTPCCEVRPEDSSSPSGSGSDNGQTKSIARKEQPLQGILRNSNSTHGAQKKKESTMPSNYYHETNNAKSETLSAGGVLVPVYSSASRTICGDERCFECEEFYRAQYSMGVAVGGQRTGLRLNQDNHVQHAQFDNEFSHCVLVPQSDSYRTVGGVYSAGSNSYSGPGVPFLNPCTNSECSLSHSAVPYTYVSPGSGKLHCIQF